VIAIQLASLDADHEHSRARLTDTVPAPPAGAKLGEEFTIDARQRASVGLVTLVTAELPQPGATDMASDKDNSRGERAFTDCGISIRGPARRRADSCAQSEC
jgi:hypothetical protein